MGSSVRWDGLAHVVITLQWNRSFRYYKKMFSIDNDGQPERNYVQRSSHGSREHLPADAANAASVDQAQLNIKQ